MNTYIGRQAIYNREMAIEGYELLYRNRAAKRSARITDEDAATRAVLSDAVSVFGISALTNNLPAYINFTRTLLVEDFAYLVDPGQFIIEVPSNVTMDNTLERKLSDLHRAGYRLALDGYSEVNGQLRFDRMIELFDIIRINVRGLNRLQIASLRKRIRRSRARFLAERIESEADFDVAMEMDFSLFQGYFFERPELLSKEIPSLANSPYGKILNELMLPAVSYDRCARVIHSDVILTYMFLRQFQNANLSRLNPASEIRHGIQMMGTEGLRRWICLVLLKQFNMNTTEELPRQAFLRGRFIERLMEESSLEVSSGKGFLLGLFSLLDKVMDVQLETLMQGLNFPPELRDAILGREENDYSLFLQYVVIYEMANERLILPDIGVRLNPRQVSSIYMACLPDTDTAFETTQITARVYQGNLLR